MKVKRICPQCGKEFKTPLYRIKEEKGIFCSNKCKWISQRKRVKHICAVCENEFEVKPSVIKKGRGKVCSKKCQTEAQKTKVKRSCEWCGAEFKSNPSILKKGGGKFCSKKCYGKWQSKYQRDKKHPLWKPRIKQICKQCGVEFKVVSYQIEKGNGMFCSLECYGKWLSENIKGKNHPNWKGGISYEPYCHKFNEEFKEYIRDKFGRVCFLCQKAEEENGQRLSVHHVNYNKNCGCDNDGTCQFVPLCRSCNTKVNKNRDMWEVKIKAMMKNNLNGWYI